MSEIAIPLALLALVGSAVLARRVLQPRLATPLALLAGAGLLVYIGVDLAPGAARAVMSSIPAADAPGAPDSTHFGDTLPEPSAMLPPVAAAGELRLVPLEERNAFRVLRGEEAVGDLSREAVAEALEGTRPSREEAFRWYYEAPVLADGVPSDRAAVAGRGERDTHPDRHRDEGDPAAREVRGGDGSARDVGELELRARASLLAVESACAAAEVLRGAADPRSRALEQELLARCRASR